MTKETFQNPQGGTKKFLYSGPAGKRRGTQFDDDVDDREWNFQPTVNTGLQSDANRSSEFDFDGVWSIKKNVNVSNTKASPSKPGPHDGWNASIPGTSYYSRHGALLGDSNADQLDKKGQSGGPGTAGNKSWGQGSSRSFSYTQGGSTSQPSGPVSQGGSTSQPSGPVSQGSQGTDYEAPRQGNGNLVKTRGISPGGRHGVNNMGRYNNNRHF